jgi:hypothetical protein
MLAAETAAVTRCVETTIGTLTENVQVEDQKMLETSAADDLLLKKFGTSGEAQEQDLSDNKPFSMLSENQDQDLPDKTDSVDNIVGKEVNSFVSSGPFSEIIGKEVVLVVNTGPSSEIIGKKVASVVNTRTRHETLKFATDTYNFQATLDQSCNPTPVSMMFQFLAPNPCSLLSPLDTNTTIHMKKKYQAYEAS